VDVEKKVLKVGVDACLGVNRGLLVCQQVIELNNADRDCFKLLRLEQLHLEMRIFQHLVGDHRCEVARFRHIPPIITVQRSICVVA